MREIEGFVCIGNFLEVNIIYGENVHLENQLFESIRSNNITPFRSIEEAEEARAQIISIMAARNVSDVSVAKIKMSIVEKDGEAQQLEGSNSFVVILQANEETRFIGKKVEGKATSYPVPGASLEMNGLKPFTDIESALYTSSEGVRQGYDRGTVAYFELELL